ncbi:MAG: ABC transporter permease [Candidatus Woesearchaeota archaeon]|nr:ABC transporter permease [Candidatus Woesearchaeota archaeon]
MLKDYIKFAYSNFLHRKKRGILTIIGILIGIAAIVALISLSMGMKAALNEEFKKVGSNRVIIEAGGIAFGPPGAGSSLSASELTKDDLDVVSKVAGVDFATGILSETARIEFHDEIKHTLVFGTSTDAETRKRLEEIGLFEIGEGRQLKQTDKYKAVLGYKVVHDLFDTDIKLGDKIKVEDKEFEVVGIQELIGTGVHDLLVRLPLDTAREIFSEPEKISSIMVTTSIGFEPVKVAEAIKKELRKFRNVKENEEDFTVQTVEQRVATVTVILDVVQAVLIGIAAISLLVGGIGIMNTMYTSVLERTNEIGIMKAIGAKNSDIAKIFLIESGLLSLAGGAIGIVIGISIAKAVEFAVQGYGITLFRADISPLLIISALAFSFLIGSVSGSLPARQAALLSPVDALRKK